MKWVQLELNHRMLEPSQTELQSWFDLDWTTNDSIWVVSAWTESQEVRATKRFNSNWTAWVLSRIKSDHKLGRPKPNHKRFKWNPSRSNPTRTAWGTSWAKFNYKPVQSKLNHIRFKLSDQASCQFDVNQVMKDSTQTICRFNMNWTTEGPSRIEPSYKRFKLNGITCLSWTTQNYKPVQPKLNNMRIDSSRTKL